LAILRNQQLRVRQMTAQYCGRFQWKGVVAVAMHPDLMTGLRNLPHQFREFRHLFAHLKEGGPHLLASQEFQQPWRVLGVRPIVKGQCDFAAVTMTIPERMRKAPTQQCVEWIIENRGPPIHLHGVTCLNQR